MASRGEIGDLRKDISYLKHQIACIMESMKVNPCACHDCLYTPTLIHSTNEIVVGLEKDEKKHSTTIHNMSDEPVNLFDDILRVNDPGAPGSAEHSYGRGKRPSIKKEILDAVMGQSQRRPNILKRRGRQRKILNLDPAVSPLKCDRLGRRFYSEDQKKAMYETYLAKGLQETAKQFGVTVTTVYSQVRRYKAMEQSEHVKVAKRLRTTSVETVRSRRIIRKPKFLDEEADEMEIDEALSEPNPKENDLDLKNETVAELVENKKQMRYYTPELKKTIYNYYLTHGRNQTMKRYNMTVGTFTYLMYSRANLDMRLSVKQALNGKVKHEKLEQDESVGVTKVDKALENGTSPIKSNSGTKMNGDIVSPPGESSFNRSDDKDFETEEGAGESPFSQSGGVRGGRRKILTTEQEYQLGQVLRTLEHQGTKITPSLLAYASKQIIKRSSNVEPDEIRISYSWALGYLKKFRDQNF